MHICFQASEKTTGYASLSLKEQLCVLTFQVPLVLIYGHEDLCASYKKSCAFLKSFCSFLHPFTPFQLFPSFWVLSLFPNLGPSLSLWKQLNKTKQPNQTKTKTKNLLLPSSQHIFLFYIYPQKSFVTYTKCQNKP